MLNLKALRKVELGRRISSLPQEIAEWQDRSKLPPAAAPAGVSQDEEFKARFANAHFSQLAAINEMVKAMMGGQVELLQQMDPAGDNGVFTTNALDLLQRTVIAQRFWDYFRDKLELRFSPKFGRRLWVSDTVAYDCYTSVLRQAVAVEILPEGSFREPPLTYLNADTSPLTWLRSQTPVEGGAPIFSRSQGLPFPVIELPWEQMENLWELMALHHEVGHDLERDLGIEKALEKSYSEALTAAHLEPKRSRIWIKWRKEVFADLVALQLGGPAFARSLASIVLLPENLVKKVSSGTSHPTHYLRIRLCAAYIRTLGGGATRLDGTDRLASLNQAADELDAAWTEIYGPQGGGDLEALAPDFDTVIRSLMDTPLAELKGQTVRSLMPYDQQGEQVIQAAMLFMIGGGGHPGVVPPRLVISAGHIAVMTLLGANLTAAELDMRLAKINEQIESLVKRGAPEGVRAGGALNVRRGRLQELAATVLTRRFNFQGEEL